MQITTTKSWDVSDEIVNQLACTIITTGVEGGIGYWSVAENYRWGSPDLGHSHQQADGTKTWKDGDTEYTTVTLDDTEGDDFQGKVVDQTLMIEVIKKLMAGEYKPFYNQGYSKTLQDRISDLFNEATENPRLRFIDADFDMDADDGDAMIQLACFGEVVYG